MSNLRKFYSLGLVVSILTAATFFIFGGGTTNNVGAAHNSSGNIDTPPGLTASEWQQIEHQLSGQNESTKLMADDAQVEDQFGIVAISGDTVVVGALHQYNYGTGPDVGAAYIFERNQGGLNNWGQVIELIPDDGQDRDYFGGSLAISGDTVVIGAMLHTPDGGIANQGAAYIFERNQGGQNNWGQVEKLTASDAQFSDLFGNSVAISGNTIVVGAYGEDGGQGNPVSEAGAAYIFERNQGGANNWGEVKKLTASDAQDFDEFSYVAISNDTIVVGAPGEDGGVGDPLTGAGAAYVFERNQGGANNLGEVEKLTASDAQFGDSFGSVAISGDTIIVGASLEDGGAGDPMDSVGAAYIFERDQGGANNWGELKKISASDAQPYDYFGAFVSINGDTILVGAYGEDGGSGDPIPNSGAVYLMKRNQGGANNWGEFSKLSASDAQFEDDFGRVAVSGDTIIVGALDEDGGPGDPINQAGAAYVFWKLRVYLPVMIKQ